MQQQPQFQPDPYGRPMAKQPDEFYQQQQAMMYHQQQPGIAYQQQQQPGIIYQQQRPIVVELPQQQTTYTNTTTYQVVVEGQNRSITCNCGYSGPANSYLVTGSGTWIWCIVIFIIYWPLFWLPFVMDSCKDNTFICPKCNKEVARQNVC